MKTAQLNLRVSEEFLEKAKKYATAQGFLTVQEWIREIVREKIYTEESVRAAYIASLTSTDATTFLSDKEADELDALLERRAP